MGTYFLFLSRQLRTQELSIRHLRDENKVLLKCMEDMRFSLGSMINQVIEMREGNSYQSMVQNGSPMHPIRVWNEPHLSSNSQTNTRRWSY